MANLPLIGFIMPNKMQKMVMMHTNRNMEISVLNINRKSIITFLNRLPYLSAIRHPKCRYLHVEIKSLKIEYRS